MTGRRSVWSNDRVIELSKQFVPATDEVWRLQHRDDPDCKYFQAMAKNGHYGPTKSSQQGIYVFAPSGKFLASVNSNDPDVTIRTMREGLAAWEKLPQAERKLIDTSLIEHEKQRIESKQPKGGLILTMFARDLPADCDPDSPCGKKWNRDTAWFSKDEARALIPNDPKVGDTYQLPDLFVQRLVALHMVDTVNGQTDAFDANEVKISKINARITEVNGSAISIELNGKTESKSDKTGYNLSPRGIVANLLGEATFDLDQQAFAKFEMVALGYRWGHTRFNFRRDERQDSNPLGFVFRLAPVDEPPTVPAFIWAYGANWLRN